MEFIGRLTPRSLLIALICVAGITFGAWIIAINAPFRAVDYNQFYSASHLAGTGHVYDWSRLQQLELQHTEAVPTGRLPVVLWGHKLLSWLPFLTARAVWMWVSITALCLSVRCWPSLPLPWSYAALTWSFPATAVLLYGQDVPLWILFFSLGLLLLQRKRELGAGLLFSLCICKFHLALGIPILLISRRNWRALASGSIGVLVWLGASFLIEGFAWPRHYREMESLAEFSPNLDTMPCLWGLTFQWPFGRLWEIAFSCLVVGLLWRICRKQVDVGLAGAAAAASGVLMAPHTYAGDCTLMLPLWVLTIADKRTPSWLRIWTGLLLTPTPVVLLFSARPLIGQLLIVSYVGVWLVLQSLPQRSQGWGTFKKSVYLDPAAQPALRC